MFFRTAFYTKPSHKEGGNITMLNKEKKYALQRKSDGKVLSYIIGERGEYSNKISHAIQFGNSEEAKSMRKRITNWRGRPVLLVIEIEIRRL